MMILMSRISYHLYVTYKCIAADVMNPGLFLVSVYLLLHHISWFR